MALPDDERISRARDNGILNPYYALKAATEADIPFWAACAFLMQETGGGRNVYGHDNTWMIGYGLVTECNYKVYKAHRARFGNQGVGPMQLTHPFFQDAADALGGCWKPYENMVAAFQWIKAQRQAGKTWHEVAKAYNGSEEYADEMDDRFTQWRAILSD